MYPKVDTDNNVQIASLPKERVARFLGKLVKHTWIAFVFNGEEVEIYVKNDLAAEHMDQLHEVIRNIA
jgi:hypothetical protein